MQKFKMKFIKKHYSHYYMLLHVIRSVVGKDLNPFVVMITDIDTTTGTNNYMKGEVKLAISISFGSKAMSKGTNMVKYRHAMVVVRH